MYKRMCAIVLFVLLLLPVCFSLAAETDTASGETEYRFDEGRFSVSVPSNMHVLTHDSTAEDLAALGISALDNGEVLDDAMLLDAMRFDDRLLELTVVMPYLYTPNEDVINLQDLNRIPEDEIIEQFGGMLRPENRDAMLADEDYPEEAQSVVFSDEGLEIYQHTQARFVRLPMDAEVDGTTVYGYMYMTFYDAEQYCIYLKRFDAPLDAQDHALLKQVVDSMRFDAAPYAEPVPSAAANVAKATIGGGLKGLILGGIAAAVAGVSAATHKKKKGVQNQPTAPYGTVNNGSDPQGPDRQ